MLLEVVHITVEVLILLALLMVCGQLGLLREEFTKLRVIAEERNRP